MLPLPHLSNDVTLKSSDHIFNVNKYLCEIVSFIWKQYFQKEAKIISSPYFSKSWKLNENITKEFFKKNESFF